MSFIDSIISKHHDLIVKSYTHPLTNQLCNGTLADEKLYVYLNQDIKFFQKGMNVFGKTLALCNDKDSAIVLGKQIGFVSNDENDYFHDCLKNLEPIAREKLPKLVESNLVLPAVKSYLEFLDFLIVQSSEYVEIITFMYVMEYVYLSWADYNINKGLVPPDLPYKFQEWIRLHSGPEFTKWVQFLKTEVERVTQNGSKRIQQLCEQTFVKAVQLEIVFFDACYDYID